MADPPQAEKDKNMPIENEEGLKKEDREFKAPVSDIRDTNQEKKFEVEIKKEDIKGIAEQMERERNKEGLKGGQSIAFIGAALEKLRQIAPEAGIEKVELTDEDIKKCKERMESDIADAVNAKTEYGKKKGWDREKIQEEIKSEQVWIREFQTSYLKDILDEKSFKEKEDNEKSLELSDEEWKGMVKDLRNLIDKKDWHKVIPRMGHMNNLEPEKFGDVSRSLFNSSDKEGMLKEIEIMRRGDEKTGRKANAWELGSRIRYVAECFPELRGRIEINEQDWKKMKKFLQDDRDKKWDKKDWEEKGKEGDYWSVAYQECNMKIIEKAIERKEIKIAKE
ncbi:hypothetical protein KKG29_01235 [Patescibacteria group bacterium]|nr:hypothetical protein [Patescibacteria group bacterium]MBU3999787.1 hypothetical protein [Patescibacteria group bacterium]MBU4368734.1 hypothetical protein [Patescibacteria group bacterium]